MNSLKSENKNLLSVTHHTDFIGTLATSYVHFKGFAARMRMTPNNLYQLEKLVDMCRKIYESGGALVIDGDDPDEGSFARLLLILRHRLPNLTIVLGVSGLKKAHKSAKKWLSTGLDFHIIVAPDFGKKWDKLGVFLMHLTNTKHVICAGGGATVVSERNTTLSEANRVWGEKIVWHCFPMTRTWKDRDSGNTHDSLQELPGWINEKSSPTMVKYSWVSEGTVFDSF